MNHINYTYSPLCCFPTWPANAPAAAPSATAPHVFGADMAPFFFDPVTERFAMCEATPGLASTDLEDQLVINVNYC